MYSTKSWWRDHIRIIGPDDDDKVATAAEAAKILQTNFSNATQIALDEKDQELEKAVLDMANRSAGEKIKKILRRGKLQIATMESGSK